MLRKMYLVSPDYLNTVTNNNSNTPTPPPPDTDRKVSEAREKRKSSRRRSVQRKKLKKQCTPKRAHDRRVAKRSAARRDYDKWFKVRAKLYEADVERKSQIKTVVDFLKQVLQTSPSSSSSPRDASHSGTQTEHGPSKLYIKSEPPPAIPAKRRIAYKTTPISSTSSEIVYESFIPQPAIERHVDDDDDDVSTDDQRVELHVLDYGPMTAGALASPYVSPYLY